MQDPTQQTNAVAIDIEAEFPGTTAERANPKQQDTTSFDQTNGAQQAGQGKGHRTHPLLTNLKGMPPADPKVSPDPTSATNAIPQAELLDTCTPTHALQQKQQLENQPQPTNSSTPTCTR